MKKGLLALLLLVMVAAVPACRQRDCLDRDRCERKEKRCCWNPCGWFKCRKKCNDEEVVVEKKKKKKCCPSLCDAFKCKKKCRDNDDMMEHEDMARDRMMRDDMAPRRMK